MNKDELLYTIMIRQPDFVTKEVIERALENLRKKKLHPLLQDIRFDTFNNLEARIPPPLNYLVHLVKM